MCVSLDGVGKSRLLLGTVRSCSELLGGAGSGWLVEDLTGAAESRRVTESERQLLLARRQVCQICPLGAPGGAPSGERRAAGKRSGHGKHNQ